MDLGLRDKVALIAASSRGLGFALARELVQEGGSVVICGRNEERLSDALAELQALAPGRAAGMAADVTSAEDAQRLVALTMEQFGRLDILVTNAGGPAGGTFTTIPPEQWQHGLQLTLMSAVRLINAGLPELQRSDAGSILTITSLSVKQPIAGLLLSNVLRPAVAGLTKTLAQELGPQGIRVNSILPGWTETERVAEIMHYRATTNGTSEEEEKARITAAIPLGRMARPEEFARAAAFLVSPAASFITGVMLLVDGGSYQGLM